MTRRFFTGIDSASPKGYAEIKEDRIQMDRKVTIKYVYDRKLNQGTLNVILPDFVFEDNFFNVSANMEQDVIKEKTPEGVISRPGDNISMQMEFLLFN